MLFHVDYVCEVGVGFEVMWMVDSHVVSWTEGRFPEDLLLAGPENRRSSGVRVDGMILRWLPRRKWRLMV